MIRYALTGRTGAFETDDEQMRAIEERCGPGTAYHEPSRYSVGKMTVVFDEVEYHVVKIEGRWLLTTNVDTLVFAAAVASIEGTWLVPLRPFFRNDGAVAEKMGEAW